MIYISGFVSCDSNKHCKSYEGLKDFSYCTGEVGKTKNYFNFFLFNNKNLVGKTKKYFNFFLAILNRYVPKKKTLIHSIWIGEVKEMKRNVLCAVKASYLRNDFNPCF
jgi:hypothetical protein